MRILLNYGDSLIVGKGVARIAVRAILKLSCQCGNEMSDFFKKEFAGGDTYSSLNCDDGGCLHGWIIGTEYDTCPKCAKKQEAEHNEWKAKFEALQQSIVGRSKLCDICVHRAGESSDFPCVRCGDNSHWEFDGKRLSGAKSDTARWKARAEALERALSGEAALCEACVHCELDGKEEPCATCYDAGGWVFNEAKYSEGGES